MSKEKDSRLVANNKKAYHDYFIEEKYEAGIELHGTEVKSLRMGKCSIKEAFVRIENGEVYICGMHISPYEKGNIFNKDPLRVKKLLLHRDEIRKLQGKIAEKGYTLVPLQVYFKRSLVKVEIGLARGKKLYDKRQDIAKKDQRREAERDFKVKKSVLRTLDAPQKMCYSSDRTELRACTGFDGGFEVREAIRGLRDRVPTWNLKLNADNEDYALAAA